MTDIEFLGVSIKITFVRNHKTCVKKQCRVTSKCIVEC